MHARATRDERVPVLFLGCIAAILFGCLASRQIRTIIDSRDAELASLKGHTEPEVLERMGSPDFKKSEGELEIWIYHHIHARSAPNFEQGGPNPAYRETFSLYFGEGRLLWWEIEVLPAVGHGKEG